MVYSYNNRSSVLVSSRSNKEDYEMKVRELIIELLKYNKDAEIGIVDIEFKGKEGCIKEDCDNVSILTHMSDKLNYQPSS